MQRPLLPQYDRAVADKVLEADPAQRTVAQQLEILATELESNAARGLLARLFLKQNPRGLYLWGDVGRGKTMLMDMFCNNLSLPQKKRVHFHAFMRDVHQAIFEERARGMPDPLLKVARTIADDVKILCFDEFAVTDVADAMILARLFTVLFGRGVTVVATSNVPPDSLYKDGLNRPLFLPFLSLLHKHMSVLRLAAAKDFRLEKFEKSGVYFTGMEKDKKFDAAWRAFAHGEKEHAVVLKVKARALSFPHTASGALRTSFSALCEAALGTEDYLEIARVFHTLFLENIPTFGPEQRNTLRRFINMIDVFYDHGVNLIASAAAEPQELVREMDGYEKDAIARTVSRLIEMRSGDYLSKAHGAAA